MSKPSRCRLTTKDLSILEAILERDPHYKEAFLRLLRQKLSTATVVFQEDIGSDVATINSRVEFTVDGGAPENRILIHREENAVTGLTLPITTIRSLALLGLSADEAIMVERLDGGIEEVRLTKVCHQPEASRKVRLRRQAPPKATPEQQSSVIAFETHRKPAPVNPEGASIDPDDNDPGPRAA